MTTRDTTDDGRLPVTTDDGRLPVTTDDGRLPVTTDDGRLPVTTDDGRLPAGRPHNRISPMPGSTLHRYLSLVDMEERLDDLERRAELAEERAAAVEALPPWMTFQQTAEAAGVSINSVRWWRQADVEDFNSRCVHKRANRLFVHRDSFFDWMESAQPR